MKTYIGVNNLARRVRKIYQGVDVKYTPVDYIESSGTQFINTKVINDNIKMIIDFALTATPSSESYGIIGSCNSVGCCLFGLDSGNFKFAYGNSFSASQALPADTNRHTAYLNDNGECKVDTNVLVDSTTIATSLNSEWWCYLFTSLGGTAKHISMKFYSCKIYDSQNNLIRDFIPVIDENNVACLFDLVENKLYYNDGTGTFSYGQTTGNQVIIPNQARLIKKGYVGDENNLAKTIYYPVNRVSQNATLLMHLNGNINDEIGIGTITQVRALTFDVNGKFEQCGRGDNSANPNPSVYIEGVGYNNSVITQNNLTIEWWQKRTSAGTILTGLDSPIAIKNTNSYMSSAFVRYSSDRYELDFSLGGTSASNFKSYASAKNWYLDECKNPKWTHCAVVFYDNGTWKIFHNGIPVSRGTTLSSYSQAIGTNKIGFVFSGAWCDELYVTREALYTEAFEVPIAPWSK